MKNIPLFSRLFRPLRNERGAALVTVGISMTAIFALMALAVDMGMLYVARNEAQRSADAAALAGGVALIENPSNPGYAKQVAIDFANKNKVAGKHVQLLPEDVDVVLGTDPVVKVRVIRSRERGSGVKTWFAQAIGINEVDLGATATSGILPAGAATCIKPFMVPDAWSDANGNGKYDNGEYYNPQETGYGSEWRSDYNRDLGRPLTLYEGSTGQPIIPGWYFLIRLPDNTGGSDIRNEIAEPECDEEVLSVGDRVDKEPGKKTGPVSQGAAQLLSEDPDAYWDESSKTVKGSKMGDAWRASPRVITFTLFDPTSPVPNGSHPMEVRGFASGFLENTQGGGLRVRFLPSIGIGTASNCKAENNCAAFAKYVSLVQ